MHARRDAPARNPWNRRMTAAPAIAIRRLQGAGSRPHLDDAARLRMAVFREWPYLYAGDLDDERGYLAAYARSPDSVFVLAFEDEAVVGVSTGLPLADAAAAFQLPFRERGLDVDRVFYFGESVLLPRCRGRGVGHAFFDHREAHARARPARACCWCRAAPTPRPAPPACASAAWRGHWRTAASWCSR